LISNPRDNHGFGQLKEHQFLRSCQKWNAFQNPDPEEPGSMNIRHKMLKKYNRESRHWKNWKKNTIPGNKIYHLIELMIYFRMNIIIIIIEY
jgi:hypothetical protein